MTPEARLDRLERIAKLFVKAGLRARRNMRETDEKLSMLISMQFQTEEKVAQSQERLARSEELNQERFARSERMLAQASLQTDQKFAKMAEAQARSDQKLAELIDIIRQNRDGKSSNKN